MEIAGEMSELNMVKLDKRLASKCKVRRHFCTTNNKFCRWLLFQNSRSSAQIYSLHQRPVIIFESLLGRCS